LINDSKIPLYNCYAKPNEAGLENQIKELCIYPDDKYFSKCSIKPPVSTFTRV
jgi:hypothetical protein